MTESSHPSARLHLPSFITAPGETDWLMIVTTVIAVAAIVLVGVFFFYLYHLPHQITRKSRKVQLEIAAVLALLGLFTQYQIFWIIGLLVAVIDLPDFGTPLNRIAGSTEKMAGLQPGEGLVEMPSEMVAGVKHADEPAEMSPETEDGTRRAESRIALLEKPELRPH